MKGPLNRTHGTQIPSSMFNSIDSLAILTFIPLLYGYIYPKLMVSNINFNISQIRRNTIGMLVAIGSLLAAFLVEMFRHDHPYHIAFDELSSSKLTVSIMSIFYQVPQYTFAGMAEVLIMVSGRKIHRCTADVCPFLCEYLSACFWQ